MSLLSGNFLTEVPSVPFQTIQWQGVISSAYEGSWFFESGDSGHDTYPFTVLVTAFASDPGMTHPYANSLQLCNAINAIAGIATIPEYLNSNGYLAALNGASFICAHDAAGYSGEYWLISRVF
jgi:hypothetical protein